MAEDDDERGAESANGGSATAGRAGADAGLPWYVKAVIVLVVLIVAFILVIDLFEFAAAV